MLKIKAQKNQSIHLNKQALVITSILNVLHIGKSNDEVRLRHTIGDVDYDFTMSAGESKDLDEDTKLEFNGVGHYTSQARSVDYVGLGFDAPRHVLIKGEWNIKGNK